MNQNWSCYCGHLSRLKFKGVRCIICRTECTVKEPAPISRVEELSGWLSCDYRNLTPKCQVLLTAHSMNLIQERKQLQ